MDGRARVGLGEHQEGLLTRLGLHQRRQLAERGGHVLVGPEDAQAGPGDAPEVVVLALPLQLVLAVAEEREVVARQPAQQLLALAELALVQRGWVGFQLVDDGEDLGAHLRPVLDALADVAKDRSQRGLDLGELGVLRHPVDLDVHPGFAQQLALVLPLLTGADLLQLTGDVPLHLELRVYDDVHVALLVGELHRDRVDQEGHVVGDDLHDRVAFGRPAVGGHGRGEHPHLRGPLGTVAGQPVVRRQRAVEVDLAAVAHVLRGHVTVVGRQQRSDRVVRRTPGPLARGGQIGGPGDQIGLAVFKGGGHDPTLDPAR